MAVETAGTTGVNAHDEFVSELAVRTGLNRDVVAAWVRAEGADAPNGTGGFNYLNVRARGQTGYSGVRLAGISSGGFAQFASVDDAVREASYWILKMGNYAGIRASVGKGSQAQLAAIAASPWDANHYSGGGAVGSVLSGAWKIVTGAGGAVAGAAGAVGGAVQAAASIPDAITGAVTGVEGWVENKAALVLAYVALTQAAAVLFVLGVARVGGIKPGDIATLGRGRIANAASGEIPF